MVKKILFATTNKGKLREIKEILDIPGIEILSLSDFPAIPEIEETGSTFEANAFLKADAVQYLFDIPVIADDSGLEVDILNGAPGIYSARYAGKNKGDKENLEKLLRELLPFGFPQSARFVCAAAFVSNETRFCETGTMEGMIISEPRGSNGFGYDPVFVPEGFELTNAELELNVKNSISHRRKAFEKIRNHLITIL